MSRTFRNYKDEKIRQYRKRKKYDKKFFGFTSGQHSRGIINISIQNGKVIYEKTDRAPIKGKDFIKYGWPCELRSKGMI